MQYKVEHIKIGSLESKINKYAEQGYRVHTCVRDTDFSKFVYFVIFEKILIER